MFFNASSNVFPFASSVIMLLVATAAPHPKVLNFISSMWLSLTVIYGHHVSAYRVSDGANAVSVLNFYHLNFYHNKQSMLIEYRPIIAERLSLPKGKTWKRLLLKQPYGA